MEVYNKNVPVFFLSSLIHPNPNKKELYTSVKLVWHSQLENLEETNVFDIQTCVFKMFLF